MFKYHVASAWARLLRMSIPLVDVGQHEKIGTDYGGWVIPVELLNRDSICYCFGAGEDISFDIGLINKFGCQVFCFDPTPRAIQHVTTVIENARQGLKTPINNDPGNCYDFSGSVVDRLHFYNYGIWNENETLKFYAPRNPDHVSHSILNLQHTEEFFEAQCYTLQHVMRMLGHDAISLLKLDVEGAEYAVVGSIISDRVSPAILCVEFDEGHNPQNPAYGFRVKDVVQRLRRYGYEVTCIDGWDYTFISRELL